MYIALFRGINVGGKNSLPMKALTEILEEKGYSDVKTYIQSGNVLFNSSLAEPKNFIQKVTSAIKSKYGFEPGIVVLKVQELEKAVDGNPFKGKEPKNLHFYFLSDAPKQPNLKGLEEIQSKDERFQLQGKVLYLYAPGGIGRSKLVSRLERLIGVPATGRNGNTVSTLLAMAYKESSE